MRNAVSKSLMFDRFVDRDVDLLDGSVFQSEEGLGPLGLRADGDLVVVLVNVLDLDRISGGDTRRENDLDGVKKLSESWGGAWDADTMDVMIEEDLDGGIVIRAHSGIEKLLLLVLIKSCSFFL
jgi:hypothetical protein